MSNMYCFLQLISIYFDCLDDYSRQNLMIGKADSVITNEELITPSSFSSSKSCNEICAQEVPDTSQFRSDEVKDATIYSSDQKEELHKNSLPKG